MINIMTIGNFKWLLFLAALAVCAPVLANMNLLVAPSEFDLIIRGGMVLDGSGRAGFRADVGVSGRKIAAIGDLSTFDSTTVIDAEGRVVSPGFIDMHSHAGWGYLVDSRAVSKLTQGITLEIEGEGESIAPIDDSMAKNRESQCQRFGIRCDWRSLDDFLARLEAAPATINFATYVGTLNVRVLAVGYEDQAASADELAHMERIVAEAMEDGALGIYSALMYPPDRYNRTGELIAMARVAAKYGGLYQTHPRSEGNAFRASWDEAFLIAREAGIAVHSTHMKLAYVQNWGRMAEVTGRVSEAQQSGLQITADIYPYDRASANFAALLPPWAQEGGAEATRQRLASPVERRRIRRELATPTDEWEHEYLGTKGGPAGITLVDAYGNVDLAPA